jgi:hypothetical protein
MTTNQPMVVKVRHPDSGAVVSVPIKDPERATLAQLQKYLQREKAIPLEDPQRPYIISSQGVILAPDLSLMAQSIRDGAELVFQREGFAA